MLSLVAQSSFFGQIFSFSHPLHLSFLFRLWRSWKLHEKSRCVFAFSLTVSLFGGHLVCATCLHTSLVFFPRTYVWQGTCVTSPAVSSHQTTKGRRRGPSIRWCQSSRCGLVIHTSYSSSHRLRPPPLVSAWPWLMYDEQFDTPSHTGKHPAYL